jgi:site-specific DNA-methyltransferase (adenine-specific)
VTLFRGDCIEVMRTLPDNSVHAVVTDPPYGLEFMGKEWDGADGFRRSLNDADAGRDNVFGRASRTSPEYRALHTFQEWCEQWASEALRVLKPGGHMLAFGGSRTWHRLAAAVEDAGFEIRDSIAWLYGSGFPKNANVLKPAFEPIVVGRKPMVGTVAVNVEKHGTGALNIDASRVDLRGEPRPSGSGVSVRATSTVTPWNTGSGNTTPASGRWPTNVVLDDSQAAELDAQTGVTRSRIGKPRGAASGEGWGMTVTGAEYDDEGGASRFFPTFRYEAKAGTDERPNVDGVFHPTVKPLELMRWLVRLATPKGGTILEPFAGSGTTLEAALVEGFTVIGIERDATYLPLIEARITKPLQVAMF